MHDDGPVSNSYGPYRRDEEVASDVPALTARGVTQSVALVLTALLMAAASFLGCPTRWSRPARRSTPSGSTPERTSSQLPVRPRTTPTGSSA